MNLKRGRDEAQIIRPGKLEARLFFFLDFKGTPSHNMTLSGQIDSPVVLSLKKLTKRS